MIRDIIEKIFFDDFDELRLCWRLLIGLVVLALFLGALMRFLGTSVIIYTKEEYEIIQDFRAKCESAGGTLGSSECYKDGELIDSIGDENE